MRTPYTPEQITYLQTNYANMPTKQIAAVLGKTERSVYQKAAVLKLFKSDEYLQRSDSGRILKGERRGSATSFKKGQAPQNKGKKQSEFMSAEGIERTKATRFQKGLKPHNTKEDFAISIRGKKNKPEKYKYIRIGLGKWQLYHRYLWERVNGEIPKGMIVAFKNGDAMDCQIDNLKLISRQDNALRNSGSLNLTPGFVAKCLARKDKEMQKELIHNHPEIIELAKLNYQLNREIKNGSSK